KGTRLTTLPAEAETLEKVKPEYRKFPGWRESTRGITELSRLPQRARDYVARIEDLVGAPVALISTGPGREELVAADRNALARLLPPKRKRTR
ncbi:MAG: adenylosuccinate synthetase, partial [bacterium]